MCCVVGDHRCSPWLPAMPFTPQCLVFLGGALKLMHTPIFTVEYYDTIVQRRLWVSQSYHDESMVLLRRESFNAPSWFSLKLLDVVSTYLNVFVNVYWILTLYRRTKCGRDRSWLPSSSTLLTSLAWLTHMIRGMVSTRHNTNTAQ